MNKIYNVATVNYMQQTECAQIQGTAKSDPALITVLNNSVEFIKAPDNIYVEKGDTIPYTLTLKNTGDITINKIEIIDVLPQGITLVPDSLKVNGTPTTGDIQSGILIDNKLLPGGQLIVSFSGKVSEIPPNVYNNKATAKYYYQVGNNTTQRSTTIISNTVVANAVKAMLEVSKSADRIEAQLEDEIIYTIKITNEGNVSANDMILTDDLPPQVRYVPNTFKVDGIAKPGVIDLAAGVSIGNLEPGKIMTVQFTTKVIENSVPVVVNKGNIRYTYTKDPNNPPVNNNTGSNITPVIIHKASLSISKEASHTTVSKGDVVTYTLIVRNTATVPAINVTVIDLIPPGMTLVPDSLTVNGTNRTGNLATGVNIGTVNVGAQSTITFKVTVTSVPPTTFNNSATAKFEYVVNGINYTGNSKSNLVIITAQGRETGCAEALTAVKSVNKTQVQQGEIITYQILIKNISTQDVPNVTLSDILNPNLSLVHSSVTVNSMPAQGSLNNLMIGTIKAGGTAIVTFQAIVIGGCPGTSIDNYATIKCTNEYCLNGPCPTESLQTNGVSVYIVQGCPPQPPCPPPCPPQPPCQKCRMERVITPIYLPNYMKCIDEITCIDGFVKSVKQISNGYCSKVLVIYIVKIEYTNECGLTYTYQQCEEVYLDIEHYNCDTVIEISSIESPCVIDRHYVEVIVNMKICNG